MSAASGKVHDVIIIGAGISGINAAYRLQTQAPDFNYTILEGRSNLGGTWDFFKYPSLRSDSDLHTFGFPFRPWKSSNPIASGPAICQYITDTAREFGIDKHIVYKHKVISASWSSKTNTWTLNVEVDGKPAKIETRFVFAGTGYYSYDQALPVSIPGLEDFKGKIVHPQFWPEDLDYSGKKIAVIGSGATAITLIPELAKKAAHVTLVQRSPGYVVSLPTKDPIDWVVTKVLPGSLAYTFLRWKYIARIYFSYYLFQSFPNFARWVLRRMTQKQLPKEVPHDPHFNPRYNPWDQRLCLCPDGDFFKALHDKNVSIVTDHIRSVVGNGIDMKRGQHVDADIIVTATGLKIQLNGGIKVNVDGKEVVPRDTFVWRGQFVSSVPNWSLSIGYTNASWTLGSDAKAQLFTRVLNYMKRNGYSKMVPTIAPNEKLVEAPLLNLNSTYVKEAAKDMPKSATTAPWYLGSFYPTDMFRAKYGSFKNLNFS